MSDDPTSCVRLLGSSLRLRRMGDHWQPRLFSHAPACVAKHQPLADVLPQARVYSWLCQPTPALGRNPHDVVACAAYSRRVDWI